MTKRTNKPKATPTASQNATKQPVEMIKQESNAKVATKGKTSTNASQKATAKPRGRPKKTKVVEAEKVIDVESRTITYVAENRAILVADKPSSLYDRFVGWLYRMTYNFRGY